VLRRDRDPAFDLIVLDPPYDHPDVVAVLAAAADRLAVDGSVVLERATRREPDVPPTLARIRDVKSGDSTLTFLVRR
jgi:16S rRNA G966 N2-methylase RsmD